MKYLTLFIICLGLISPHVFAKKVALLISGYGNETQGKISYDLEELAQTYLVLHNHNLELDIVTPKGGEVVVKTNKDNLAYIQKFKGDGSTRRPRLLNKKCSKWYVYLS